MVETVFNRFFEGEEVLLSEMMEAVGEENEALLTLVINVGYVCGLVVKHYLPGGQKRQLTAMGLGFYELIKGLFEAGAEDD